MALSLLSDIAVCFPQHSASFNRLVPALVIFEACILNLVLSLWPLCVSVVFSVSLSVVIWLILMFGWIFFCFLLLLFPRPCISIQ